ncbi:hypothetical protein WISP_58313 [Willisornis vidua]|uniref:FHA domain-containing protein n=1 Tax=Willisornis vidua TaxID=1566151 RepID=A0ABQ9DBA5_9PASS|nr:hypothetical protein WISP_58313 [Willisornis vidua]
MTRYGKIIVIKRDGTDGLVYPLTSTSCLFGRKTECDIRMRLPWVSSEHCRIEINENKEAVLINLSTVNPTQLNGVCLEQPVPLKHRDVLTIIDRSFRFEYPLQSTPKKRRSRSSEGETLQILHVQQVAQVELLHQQTSRSESVGASGNAECEEKIANENKQTTGDTVPKALPVKLRTPKSSQRLYRVDKKQTELSPFSKLYESLKNEVEVKKPLPKGNASQQAAREDGESVVPKPNAQIPLSGCVDDLDKGKERDRRENTEECVIVRCFSRNPRNSLSQEVSKDTGQRHLQDPKELSSPGQSKGAQVIPSKENCGNPQFQLPQCSIECLECPAKGKIHCSATHTPNGSGADGCVVSTPTSRRKSPRALVTSPGEAASGTNPGNADTPTSRRRLSLKPKSLSGIVAEAPRGDPDVPQLPFPENKSFKQRRNSKARPATPAQEVLTEIGDQANVVNSKVGHPETPAALSNSKSSRRNSRQSKGFSDKSVHLETLASEELMASPAAQEPGSGRKRRRPRSSGMLMETAQERNTVQEHPGENRDRKESGTPAEPAVEGGQQEQDLEGAGGVRPRRLSAKSGSAGSAPVLRDSEAAPETNTSGLLDGEDSGQTKKLHQKRKSDDLLPQTVGKRKRVSFGGHLSPELFDKSLPPNSPLKRGALPARRSLPCGTPARVVLKKAQGLQPSADQTPEKKIKGHFSTGHAESPATIVVGRAYSTTLRSAGHVPKVVTNPILKLNMNMDESFTGVPEMFQTPHKESGKTLPLAAAQNADVTPTCAAGEDISDLHTPEECGEMMVSPLNSSDASEQKQESPGICHLLREKSSLSSEFDEILTKTPEKRKAVQEDAVSVDSLSVIPEKRVSLVKSGGKRGTPRQKLEPVEVVSGIKQLLRTPEQRSEAGEVLSGIKQLLRTPKRRLEPEEVLSGIKQLMKTPKQKLEPAEVLSGIKQLLRTPKRKPEPVEVLSAIKWLLRTPKQKQEPAENLSGIKQLMRTPKQKSEHQLMRTPKQKVEPAEVLSCIKQLMKTPKQKLEPAEVLSGIKQLMRTPWQKPEPVEDLSGIKELMRTPQQETEPVLDEIALQRLLKTPVQRRGAVGGAKKSPKLKYPPVEDMVGLSRIFRTPKEKGNPVESMFGISRLVRSPRQKHQPVEDFVGLPRLMAEPRQKLDCEVDYDGMTEMFDAPEEMEVTSVNVTDSQQDSAPPCSNSRHKYENKGKISQGEDSQPKQSPSEEQSPQRWQRGRPRRTVHPAPAKQCEKDGNSKELGSLDTTSTQEEVGTIPSENRGRGRRRKCSLQEVVSKHPDQEPHGATQRPGRGKRKELEELKPPSDNPESCVEDSSVLQKEAADGKQSLQECGTDGTLEAEGAPATKAGSGHTQSENCQLQTGVNKPGSTSNDSGLEDSEEVLLPPRKRARGAESTELLIPPKRGRRYRNDQVKQDAPAELHGTTRRLRRDPAAQGRQREEQASDKDPGAGTAEPPESETKLQVKVAEKRVKSLRSTRNRRHSGEVVEADTCGVALENTQTSLKTEEKSAQTDGEAQPHIKNEMEVSQGYKTENGQEIKTEASHRIKAESPSGETNKMPVTALKLEENRSAVQERSRTRNKRGKKDSLEQKADEFTKDGNNSKLIPAKFNSETEVDESLKEDQPSPAATSAPAANSDSPAPGHQKQTRNQQGILKPNETEILQENPAQGKGVACRRGRGRKVHFELREASSKEVAGKRSLPEDGKGMTDNDQHENSENPSQVRRSRRRQVDSIPQTATPTFVEKQTLTADHSKDEASVKEQDATLECAPCSAGANPPRRGRRREVAAASQAPRAPPVRTRRGLLGGGDEKVPVREDENPALGNETLQAKASASARDKRKKIDPAAEAKSSAPLQRKGALSEADAKGEGANEEQSAPLETESCAEEKPLGRGRRKEAVLASHTTSPVSLRGKRGLRANTSREEAPKVEEKSVPLETWDSSVKENHLRRGRRKTLALLEAAGPKQGEQDPSKQSGRKSNYREVKQVILGNSSLENRDLSKENLRQTITSVAFNSTSLQGLPEDHKNGAPEELVAGAPSAKENPPRTGRKKTTSSISEQTPSTSLEEKPTLPKGRGQKGVLREGEATPAENNSCQGRTRQVRNNRRKVQLMLEAATSSLSENSELQGNGNDLETENLCKTSTGFEGGNLFGKGKDGNPTHQVVSASKRKCQLPADDLAPKKLKSGNDGNGSVGRAKRKKTEELGKENVRAAQTSGITERKTRSSTRTRK